MPPTQFILPPRYASSFLIAHGGMGEVFGATDQVLGRVVAIKVLAERYARDDEFRARFTREAQVAARLSSEPNIVVIFDVGEADGRPYIVMEYLPGGSLDARLQAGAIEPNEALAWLEQAARALDCAHARGVVHRDVKPANLLLGADGEVRVTDFGIARAAGDATLTIAGTILGTAGYMAPEQVQGERATPASDRYSLGCVAFHLLTGRRPFVAESLTAEATAHATAAVPSATSVNPRLPPSLDDVFARALAKDPGERPASCAGLVADLRDAWGDDVADTVPFTGVTWPAPPPPTAATARDKITARRWRPGAVAAGVAAALFAGGAIAAALVAAGGDASTRTVVQTETLERIRTETAESKPEVTTVTVPATETVTVTEPEPPAAPSADGAALNDEGYSLLQEGDYEAALPLFEQAVAALQGSGSLAEAYASYNLALSRLQLGRCDGVVELLDRSQEVQGERKEIDRLRKQARRACGED